MQQRKGLSLKDHHFINQSCRTIAKCERYGVTKKELRQQIYMLGLFTFRQFHHAGHPADYKDPGLNSPARLIGTRRTTKYHNEHVSTNTRMDNGSKSPKAKLAYI